MSDGWDEVRNPKLPPREALFTPNPVHLVIGLIVGSISAVVDPGMLLLLPITWMIPAVLAALLYLVEPARSLATGFAAASVGWLTFYVAFYVYGGLAQ